MNAETSLTCAVPVQGRKVQQVIEGAREVFLRDGFEGASVDAIAREAGVSKATLYSYFSDKKVLFLAVAKGECIRQGEIGFHSIDFGAPVPEVLRRSGEMMMEFITSDLGQRIFRVCVAESERFPDLAREFYETGPMVMREHMIQFLRAACERGELRIHDFTLAAEQFHELCKADIMPRLVFGVGEVTRADIRRTIEAAVEMFMARYGTA